MQADVRESKGGVSNYVATDTLKQDRSLLASRSSDNAAAEKRSRMSCCFSKVFLTRQIQLRCLDASPVRRIALSSLDIVRRQCGSSCGSTLLAPVWVADGVLILNRHETAT